jgi:type VI secretion system secreted protein VgrG
MAQPYGGSKHGMHFPLQKGTEVLLTFVNGDPDRPIITAAVPNPAMPSLVTSANQTANIIHTSGGNKIHLEDLEGSQHLLLHSPAADSMICLGLAPTPATDGGLTQEEGSNVSWTKTPFTPSEGIGIHLATSKWIDVKAQFVNELVMGGRNSVCLAERFDLAMLRSQLVLGFYSNIVLGGKHEYKWPKSFEFSGARFMSTVKEETAVKTKNEIIDEVKRILLSDTEVVGNKLQIVNKDQIVADNKSSIIMKYGEIINNSTVFVEQNIEVRQNSMEVQEQKLMDSKTQINISNMNMEQFNEKVSDINLEINKAGTHIIQSKTQVNKSEIQINDSQLTSYN